MRHVALCLGVWGGLLLQGAFCGESEIYGATPGSSVSFDNDMPDEWGYLFEQGELFADVYYLGLEGDDRNHRPGVGTGLGYFFHRNWAVQTEVFWGDVPGDYWSVYGGLTLRLPVDRSALAFYGFTGVGGQWENGVSEATWHAGGGIDVRMTDDVSTFADVRYIEPEDADTSTVWRVGLRFLF